MKENIETTSASQYDPRQGMFLYKVLHFESCLYEGFVLQFLYLTNFYWVPFVYQEKHIYRLA